MDIDDIRQMIRVSIKTQVRNIVESRRQPPQNFSDFNFLLKEALKSSNLDDVEHDISYGIWENVSMEMQGLDTRREKINEWNSSLEYYVSRSELPKIAKSVIIKHLMRK